MTVATASPGTAASDNPLASHSILHKRRRTGTGGLIRRFPPALIAEPGGLYEACGPRAPLVRVEPERAPHLLAPQPPKLRRHELQILRHEREPLHFGDRLNGARGRRQHGARPRVQRPRQQLLPAELARPEPARVEEPGPAAVRRVRVQMAPDYENHLVHRVTLPDQTGAQRPQTGSQSFAYRIQHCLLHFIKKRHLSERKEKLDENRIVVLWNKLIVLKVILT